MSNTPKKRTRREFLGEGIRAAGLVAVSGAFGSLWARGARGDAVWQLDPEKCIQCDKCATACVLNPSAVKAVNERTLCGYCDLCFGFFEDQRPDNQATAENERCPTNAIRRSFVEDPYWEYIVDEPLCIGCAKCVKGCNTFGNSALSLQVRHDRCLNCNQCEIARVCPANAFVRVPAEEPYLLKTRKRTK